MERYSRLNQTRKRFAYVERDPELFCSRFGFTVEPDDEEVAHHVDGPSQDLLRGRQSRVTRRPKSSFYIRMPIGPPSRPALMRGLIDVIKRGQPAECLFATMLAKNLIENSPKLRDKFEYELSLHGVHIEPIDAKV